MAKNNFTGSIESTCFRSSIFKQHKDHLSCYLFNFIRAENKYENIFLMRVGRNNMVNKKFGKNNSNFAYFY